MAALVLVWYWRNCETPFDKYTQIALRKSALTFTTIDCNFGKFFDMFLVLKEHLRLRLTLWHFLQGLWCRPLSEVVRFYRMYVLIKKLCDIWVEFQQNKDRLSWKLESSTSWEGARHRTGFQNCPMVSWVEYTELIHILSVNFPKTENKDPENE